MTFHFLILSMRFKLKNRTHRITETGKQKKYFDVFVTNAAEVRVDADHEYKRRLV